jgi:nitroreductase
MDLNSMIKKKQVFQDMNDNLKPYDDSEELKPDSSFVTEALPGFTLALKARRAIRKFDGKPIPEQVMRNCLQDALLAPSSSNLQPFELYWIRTDQKKKDAMLACLGQPAATTAGEIVVVIARPDTWSVNLKKLLNVMTEGGMKTLPDSVSTYYKKLIPAVMVSDPFGIINFSRRIFYTLIGLKKPMVRTPVNKGDHRILAHVQAALVAQTFMLSLSAHGYDSCPIGGMDAKRIKKILNLPRRAEVNMVISAGRRIEGGLYGPRVRLANEDLIKEV